jgi:ATP phosphoribosyltransferase
MFARAGYRLSVGARSYLPRVDDPELEVRLMRAQEIPRYVAAGFLDLGITGKDWILETRSEVVEVCDLVYSKATLESARWVLAVHEDSPYNCVADLKGKRIATELVQVTRDYLEKSGVEAEVEYSLGATEVKVPELVEAIVDITETGRSLRANKLRVIGTVLETNTKVIASAKAWKEAGKKRKIENLSLLLRGALLAEQKVGLKMNVPRSKLEEVTKLLPALREPTVSPLSDPNWTALETILDEKVARDLIPELLKAGAEGIIEYPLNKVIP